MRRVAAAKAVAGDSGSTRAAERIDPYSSDPSIPSSHPPASGPSYPLPLPALVHRLLFHPACIESTSAVVLLLELALCLLIIRYVSYTEIDWVAYMQETEAFLQGERDYRLIRGDTGPLVYPAGFLYLYSALRAVTSNGQDVLTAQLIFAVLYVAVLWLVHRLYIAAGEGRLPPYVLLLLSVSKRLHSIFVLRLFNDCWAMLLLYASMLLMLRRRWWLSSLLFSLALSVKMNILLFAPAFLLLLLHRFPVRTVVAHLLLMLAVQVAVGLPFLLSHPASYLSKAFELSRVFLYKWTVNLKLLPEPAFLHPATAAALLTAHLTTLLLFLNRYAVGGIAGLAQRGWQGVRELAGLQAGGDGRRAEPQLFGEPGAQYAVSAMLVSNFIGVVFARSLHYQFYAWYAHSLPLLLHLSPPAFPPQLGTGVHEWLIVVSKCAVLLLLELSWNVYPATWWSSALLIACHAVLLYGAWRGSAGMSARYSSDAAAKPSKPAIATPHAE